MPESIENRAGQARSVRPPLTASLPVCPEESHPNQSWVSILRALRYKTGGPSVHDRTIFKGILSNNDERMTFGKSRTLCCSLLTSQS